VDLEVTDRVTEIHPPRVDLETTDWTDEIRQLHGHLDGLSRFCGNLLPAACEKALRILLRHLENTIPAIEPARDSVSSSAATEVVRRYLELRGLLVEFGRRERLDRERPLLEFVLDRLLADDHLFLRRCARRPLDELDAGLTALMRADLRAVQGIATCRLGVWIAHLTGLDLGDPLAPPPVEARRAPSWDLTAPSDSLKAKFRESNDWSDLVRPLAEFVFTHGFGPHQGTACYRLGVAGDTTILDPIDRFSDFDLSWFEGNESRVAVLEANTRNLLGGLTAHNVLIWGSRGCGKSSLIRGLISRYYEEGLRGIEVPRALYHCLADLFALVRGRKESFIAVLDNISLAGDDSGHRALSSILDGGLQDKPPNLVFYATSNFKDLIDREGERPQGPPQLQMDGPPTAEEATAGNSGSRGPRPQSFDPQERERLDERRALDDRFALKVFIDLPRKKAYEHLVLSYAHRAGIDIDDEELLSSFRVWRMRHNHDLVGGRTARDFIVACFPLAARDTPRGAVT
jgi:predicted AAA+ superfamily ATPase